MEREKFETEESMTKSSVEKSLVDHHEDENTELRQQLQTLQTQLGRVEKEHVQRSIYIIVSFS